MSVRVRAGWVIEFIESCPLECSGKGNSAREHGKVQSILFGSASEGEGEIFEWVRIWGLETVESSVRGSGKDVPRSQSGLMHTRTSLSLFSLGAACAPLGRHIEETQGCHDLRKRYEAAGSKKIPNRCTELVVLFYFEGMGTCYTVGTILMVLTADLWMSL